MGENRARILGLWPTAVLLVLRGYGGEGGYSVVLYR